MLYSSTSRYTKAERWLQLSSRPHSVRGASRFRGVQRSNSNPNLPWRASLRFDGRTYNGGSFATEEDAALAWNELALKVVGPLAQQRLNAVPTPAPDFFDEANLFDEYVAS
jgi:hypothetical protein